MKREYFPFILLIAGLFGVLVLPSLFQKGMFLDGVIYATISRNLSEGLGSLWHLVYTETQGAHFKGHPPLIFGLQSFFFEIFGDQFWVERLYSICIALLNIGVITLIWKDGLPQFKNIVFFPILFWITIPIVFTTFQNNLLENTGTLFCLLAILFVQKGMNNKVWYWILASGIATFFCFFSKGLSMLFPLAAIFLYLITHRFSVNALIKNYSIFALILIVGITIIHFIFPMLATSGLNVIKEHTAGIQIKTGSRFYILERILLEHLPLLLLVIIIFIRHRKSVKKELSVYRRLQSISLFWVLIGCSASLPILLSFKQYNHYVFPSTPFFVLGLSGLIAPYLQPWSEKLLSNMLWRKMISGIGISLIILSIFLTIKKQNTYQRDSQLLMDIEKIGKRIDTNKLSVANARKRDWLLPAYFMRNEKISLENNQDLEYLIAKTGDNVPSNYKELNLALKELKIYKKE